LDQGLRRIMLPCVLELGALLLSGWYDFHLPAGFDPWSQPPVRFVVAFDLRQLF